MFSKISIKYDIFVILKPKRCCLRNARFKVRDCMRMLRFEVRNCMIKVRFIVRLHEKCVARRTIILLIQISASYTGQSVSTHMPTLDHFTNVYIGWGKLLFYYGWWGASYFEPQHSHAVTYFEPRIYHETPF